MPVHHRHAAAIGLAFALTALTANVAAAQQGTPAQRAACTPDAYRLCGIYIPNAAAITQCLRANRKRLSRDCRAVFEGRLK